MLLKPLVSCQPANANIFFGASDLHISLYDAYATTLTAYTFIVWGRASFQVGRLIKLYIFDSLFVAWVLWNYFQ